jgi:hypothetical protein
MTGRVGRVHESREIPTPAATREIASTRCWGSKRGSEMGWKLAEKKVDDGIVCDFLTVGDESRTTKDCCGIDCQRPRETI